MAGEQARRRQCSNLTMRTLICGGRHFADADLLWTSLDQLNAETPGGISEVITGDGPGAEMLAVEWAQARNIPYRLFIADRVTHGRSAGAIRNQDMLDTGKPDLVVAFSGGRGTADLVRRAGKAGVAVRRPGSEPI
jgi:hypothetical protein